MAINERLYTLIESVVAGEGLELVHCEFVGSGKQPVLRVYIDRPGGVTHDHCTHVSRQLSTLLDVEDIITHQYLLEVSSPGVNRGLYKEADYERFAGELLKLKTSEPIEGRRNFKGRLVGIKNGIVTIVDSKGERQIPFGKIHSANIEVDLDELFRRAEKMGS